MSRIYLIRHGRPDFPTKERWCLGKTDLPLSPEGMAQAALTRDWLSRQELGALFTSPLGRARETAAILAGDRLLPQAAPGLEELGHGLWDGLSFSEIRARFPELYERRGVDPLLRPPGAEDPALGAARALEELRHLARSTAGSFAAVSHRSILRALLSSLTDAPVPELPYGSVSCLHWEGEKLTVEYMGELPWRVPSDALLERWHQRAETPEPVRRHEAAVAEMAEKIAAVQAARGISLDRRLLRAAALCHDLLRTQPEHARKGAAFLRKEGYRDLAAVVELHHGAAFARVDEAAVLCYADKLLDGEQVVSLEERFEKSKKKCGTPEAKEAHGRRYREALALKALLGMEE